MTFDPEKWEPDAWREMTQEDWAVVARSGPEWMARMASEGWFRVPNEEHPDVMAAMDKMVRDLAEHIDAQIVGEFSS